MGIPCCGSVEQGSEEGEILQMGLGTEEQGTQLCVSSLLGKEPHPTMSPALFYWKEATETMAGVPASASLSLTILQTSHRWIRAVYALL